MKQVKRSKGTTRSERKLASLCEATFLGMWSYPNLYRDQRSHNKTTGGKELCDLLAMCGDDAIIFSDKACAFPASGDDHLDWQRWFKRSVDAAAKQIFGAERWIENHPARIFLDEACLEQFPLAGEIETRERTIHRVVVASVDSTRCAQSLGGIGTLAVSPTIEGSAHTDSSHEAFRPFAVGDVDPARGFVHVFDDASIEIVLRELDTVSDLIGYLSARERAVRSKRLLWARGEEDLLALYVANTDSEGRHCIPVDDDSLLVCEPGSWRDVLAAQEYRAKQVANQVSYHWDARIQELSRHAQGGTLEESSDTTIRQFESALRLMALESRFHRRILGEALSEKVLESDPRKIGIRTVLSPRDKSLAYVFLVYPLQDGVDYQSYRTYRRLYAQDYCFVLACQRRELSKVVAIATESGGDLAYRSHTLVYVEPINWTHELELKAARIQRERGFLAPGRTTERRGTAAEYPTGNS